MATKQINQHNQGNFVDKSLNDDTFIENRNMKLNSKNKNLKFS